MPNVNVAVAAAGLPSATFNRRRMLHGLAAVFTAAGAPASAALAHDAAQAFALSTELAEVVAIFDQLNPSRKARSLASLRDSLAAQRIIDRSSLRA
ncbi:hypothetical protein [Bosea sp. (in: a-proteobacteria)]|uniref:hypothetical protein n=1 Tax=Bosea sp. (in: a-proteobacteria) TaxID=1871050 RepID=UPI001AC04A3C|nr:hypothetical protein [Bosea sp. (in: a-proteobacteria)]MBN9438827.1 hypothetical protein [Bosea sp. (in: a-proteobacteria)]